MDILKTLDTLNAAFGPSGCEEEVAAAIAKLAPDSVIGEGLSVHYSGGASLPSDVAAWLKTNGIIE